MIGRLRRMFLGHRDILALSLAREYTLPLAEAEQIARLVDGDAALAHSFLKLALAANLRSFTGELRRYRLDSFAAPSSEREAIQEAFRVFTSDGCLLISSPRGAEVVAGVLRKAVRAGYSTPTGEQIWRAATRVR